MAIVLRLQLHHRIRMPDQAADDTSTQLNFSPVFAENYTKSVVTTQVKNAKVSVSTMQ